MTSNSIYIPSFICVLNVKTKFMTKIDSIDSFLNLVNNEIFKSAKIKFIRISNSVEVILKQIENSTISKRNLFKLLKGNYSKNDVLKFRGYSQEEIVVKNQEMSFNNYDVNSVMQKFDLSEAEAKIKINELLAKNITPSSTQYWINKGYSEEISKFEVIRHQTNAGKSFAKNIKENPENYRGKYPTCLEYYLAKGLNLEGAKFELKDRQTTFSIDKLLLKHPEDEAFRLWNLRQEKWQNSMNSKSDDEKIKINKARGLNKNGIPHSIGINESLYEEICILYYLKIIHSNTEYFKIGITKNINDRFGNLESKKLLYDIDIKILFTLETNRLTAYNIEQKILKDYNHKRTSIRSGKFSSTEIFTENILSNFDNYLTA